MAKDLVLGIFQWNSEIAGYAKIHKVLVARKELLNVLCVVARFALNDFRAGRAVETVFDLIHVVVAFPKGERADTGFQKEIIDEGVANAGACRTCRTSSRRKSDPVEATVPSTSERRNSSAL